MRGCAVSLLLALLVATNGYCLWQIGRLRAEVATLHREIGARSVSHSDFGSAYRTAREALEAVRRGDWARAREALDTLSTRVRGAEPVTAGERTKLQQDIARAREVLGKPGREAAKRLQRVLRDLSVEQRREDDTENARVGH